MQKLSEIKQLLARAGHRPRRGLGQSFLIDPNLMNKLVSLAGLTGGETVLEVGAATGSLTEELLGRARRVVAVEMDKALAEILGRRLSQRENLTILNRDALAGKHALAAEVLAALAPDRSVHLVANLPFSVAVPVIINCLLRSWQAVKAGRAAEGSAQVRFDTLTFTVQKELADRLTAGVGEAAYGRVSVIVALLSRVQAGKVMPPEAFWPRPKVHSQMVRLDFDAAAAARLADAASLCAVLSATFGLRRKQVAAAARSRSFPFPREQFLAALASAGIDAGRRPQEVAPGGFLALANLLACPTGKGEHGTMQN
ncbi:MAG: hypothetical protein AMJ81_06270 [Phycisphaerae bacterium SM23_33]|nr:MAG: hypothetical protein AMJ81_06270 [Phycisphaerae bacterium SM23_33]